MLPIQNSIQTGRPSPHRTDNLFQTRHSPTELMQLEAVRDANRGVVSPPLGRSVAARRHQPMRNGHEDRKLDRKIKPSPASESVRTPAMPHSRPQALSINDDKLGKAKERLMPAASPGGIDDPELGPARRAGVRVGRKLWALDVRRL